MTSKIRESVISQRDFYWKKHRIALSESQCEQEGGNLDDYHYILKKYRYLTIFPLFPEVVPTHRTSKGTSPELIQEYRTLYKTHFGLYISYEDAVMEQEGILNLLKLLTEIHDRHKGDPAAADTSL